MSGNSFPERLPLQTWKVRSAVCGLLALAICVAGALLGSPAQFFRAYFTAYMFYLGLALGGMAILMLYHLTGGAWGYLIRRVLEAQTGTLLLLAILFVPIGFGIEHLYLWARPNLVAADVKLQEQQFYLNPRFFLARAAVYFVIWLAFAFALRLRSRRQERTGDSRLPWKFQRLSEIGLVLYGTTIHFAAFDWMETLQPSFHSTIFPMTVASGQLLSAHAFALIVFVRVVRRTEAAEVASTRALNDLGNILLAFLIIWAYLSWFQFMLIWIANLPSDVLWYSPRWRGGWYWVTWALGLGNFAVPFFALLLRSVKSNAQRIVPIAGLVLFMQLVFIYYQITPSFAAPSLAEHWMDFVAPIGLGGIWLAWFLNRLQTAPLLVANDPNREIAISLREHDQEDMAAEQLLA